MMKDKIIRFFQYMADAFKYAPVEIFITLVLFVHVSLVKEEVIANTHFDWLIPIFFTISFLLNKICLNKYLRILYYVSAFLFIPFLGMDVQSWIGSVGYAVALIICIFAIFLCGWYKDNRKFILNAIRYIYDAVWAFFISGVAFLLIQAIFYSIVYIFNVMEGITTDFSIYSSMLMFFVVMPLVFLTFNNRKVDMDTAYGNRIFDILQNYVFVPAVLIYTVILYLYFGKIVITWTLPKGGIAYLVFAFTIIAMLVKAARLLQQKPICNWFFNNFSLISIPALTMFWIGVWYRIGQYGFTESRVYLAVCGIIMTVILLIFINSKTGRYLYGTLFGIVMLVIFTYIPGATAKEIGLKSQIDRIKRMSEQLALCSESGKFIIEKRNSSDTVAKEQFRAIYESLEYVERNAEDGFLTQNCGIESSDDFVKKIVPESIQDYVWFGNGNYTVVAEEAPEVQTIYLSGNAVKVTGFSTVKCVREKYAYENAVVNSSPYVYEVTDGALKVTLNDKEVFNQKLEEILEKQLSQVGLSAMDSIPEHILTDNSDRLLQYDADSLKLIFYSMDFVRDPGLKLTDVYLGFMLGRNSK